MGVDLSTYRAKIGSFVMPGQKLKRCAHYNPCVEGTDICHRTFAVCTFMVFIMSSALAVKHTEWLFSQYIEPTLTYNNNIDMCVENRGLHSSSITETIPYQCFSMRLIMLSADVETNPGPDPLGHDNDQNLSKSTSPETSPETQMVLAAISALSVKLTKEISDVKTEVVNMKHELKDVKFEIENLKGTTKTLKSLYHDHEQRIDKIDTYVEKHMFDDGALRSDVDELDYVTRKQDDQIENLGNVVDRVENMLIKNDLRVFGLAEKDQESESDTMKLVSENVLTHVFPDGEDDLMTYIESARRVGKPKDDQERMVIVKFKSFRNKLRVLTARDILRQQGIRVSNELTTRQRAIMRSKNEQGIRGYFKNGKFCELGREDSGRSRVFLRGRRQYGNSTRGPLEGESVSNSTSDYMELGPQEVPSETINIQ